MFVKLKIWLVVLLAAFVLTGCGSGAKVSIVPLPAKVESQKGNFRLTRETEIIVDNVSEQSGHYLVAQLQRYSGQSMPVPQAMVNGRPKGVIELTARDIDPALGPEGYQLAITPDSVVIRGQPAGL